MKKVINILLIAILSIIFIGLTLFVVNFAKDTFISDNKKSNNVSNNKEEVKKTLIINRNKQINKTILYLVKQVRIIVNKLIITINL